MALSLGNISPVNLNLATPSSGNLLEGPGLLSLSNVNTPGTVGRYDDAFNNRPFIQPVGVQQIGAFVFDYEGDDSVTLDNDITDHWIEDNTAVQDHIGVRPNVVTLRGQVSNLSLSKSLLNALNVVFTGVQNGLSQAPAYLGQYTPGVADSLQTAVSQAENLAIQIEQSLARGKQIASYFNSTPARDKQQAAYNQLASLRDARVLFTVYTPFQVFYNMGITSLRFTQPASTKYLSDVTVTMKQIRTASVLSSAEYAKFFGGNLAQNGQAPVISGSTSGLADGSTVGTTSVEAFPALA